MIKKVFVSFLLFLIISVSIMGTVNLLSRKQETRSEAVASTTLSVSPASLTKNAGETFSVNITIETGTNQINGADLFLSFSPGVLEAVSIAPGSFLTNAQEIGSKQLNNTNGKIVYSLGVFDNANAKSGSGTLATITFRAKEAGTSPLTFTAGTSVAAVGETEALKNKVNGNVTVTGGANPTATPTPTSPAIPTSPPISSPSSSPAPVSANFAPTLILTVAGLALIAFGLTPVLFR